MAEDSPTASAPGITFMVPLEALQSERVGVVVGNVRELDLHELASTLSSAAEKARPGDQGAADALQLLATLSAFHFEPKNRARPFSALMTFGDRRSPIPDDLPPEQVATLAAFSAEIANPSLRARVSDVCRVRVPKDWQAGLRAVAAYVEGVELVRQGQGEFARGNKDPASVPARDMLRRATILARAMGWDRPEFDLLKQVINELTQLTAEGGDSWGFIRIAELNLDNSIWERRTLAGTAEKLAQSQAVAADFSAQRMLWDLAALAFHKEKDADNANRCRIASAETFVGEADARTDSAIVQASFLDSAIQALRPVPGTAARRKALLERLNAVQPQTLDEMSSFSHEQDITELVKAVEELVQGKTLAEVIRTCFTCASTPDPTALRDASLAAAQNSIFAMMPFVVSDHQGRTRFKAPGLNPTGPQEEEQVRFLVNHHDQFRRQLVVASRVNPIRRVLVSEHYVSLDALMPVMLASPFVPPDHEFIFASGALKFLIGEDIAAAHLLLPQLENSLRYILSRAGVETTRLNQDGTQEEAMLSRLLEEYREPLLKVMSDGLLNEIDLLFNFRGGPSLRHELAHGKMTDSDFWAPDVTYAVWLVIRLAVLPVLQGWSALAVHINREDGN